MLDAESQATDAYLPIADRIRHLAAAHHMLDARLRELTTHWYLTDTESREGARLKKRKLALKDEIARLSHES